MSRQIYVVYDNLIYQTKEEMLNELNIDENEYNLALDKGFDKVASIKYCIRNNNRKNSKTAVIDETKLYKIATSISEQLDEYEKRKNYITYNGVEYKNVTEIISKLGISKDILKRALDHGYTIKAAIDYAVRSQYYVIYDNKKYYTQQDLANDLAISSVKLRNIIRQGKSVEDALEIVIKNSPRRIKINNVWYKSLNAACSKYNVRDCSVRFRMDKYNETAEEAFNKLIELGKTKPIKNRVKINIYGMEFNSKSEACNFFSVNTKTLNDRVKNYNISYDEALKQLVEDPRKIYDESGLYRFNNMYFKSKYDACEKMGVMLPTVQKLMRRYNIKFNKALDIAINCYKKGISINNKPFKNLREATTEYKLVYYDVLDRIVKNDEKIETVVLKMIQEKELLDRIKLCAKENNLTYNQAIDKLVEECKRGRI